MGLKEAIQNIWASDYVQKNPNKQYKVTYADEYAKVAAYINGGAEPNWSSFSKLGKGLCESEKVRRDEIQPTNSARSAASAVVSA
jgi:bisphosphoglycerate-independent phosphoglycerate mutase (AlkP superfamily)